MVFFHILLAILSVLLIIVILFQSSKDDINDAFSGGKSELFKNQKSRGLEAALQKSTWVLGALFFVVAIVCAFAYSL